MRKIKVSELSPTLHHLLEKFGGNFRHLLLSCALLFFANTLQAQEWLKKVDGSNGYNSIAINAAGDVYTMGVFDGTQDFDPGPGTFTLTSTASSRDVYILKLNSTGDFVWAKQIAGPGDDIAGQIKVDAAGHLYITGRFANTADFDPNAGVANLTAVGLRDAFVCKLDANGDFIWAKNFGGPSDEEGLSVAVDASGNVFTTGYFFSTTDFNLDLPGTSVLTSFGNKDIFICKLDANGAFVWVKQIGTTGPDTGNSITVSPLGNIYVGGRYINPLTSMFIAKLDNAGTILWSQVIGTGGVNGIATDASENVYATGNFFGLVDFDTGSGTSTLTGGSHGSTFVLKLAGDGSFNWVNGFGAGYSSVGNSVVPDASGNVYMTGNSDDDEDGGYLTYVAYDATGSEIINEVTSGVGRATGTSITADLSGSVYLSGYFNNTVNFSLGGCLGSLTSGGEFIMKKSSAIPSGGGVPLSERNALIALYTATNGPGWIDNSNWLSADEGTWFGVTVECGHVTEINLNDNGLFGTLPPELGNFPELTVLILSGNALGDAIPPEIGSLTNLDELNLSVNEFTGSVPSTFSNLLVLRVLNVSNNTLVGVDPPVGTLPVLEVVRLSSNNLGFMPTFTSPFITELAVENNNLDFADLEPNIGVAGFTYVPQARLNPGGVINFALGSTLTIPFTANGSANSYQWYKGGELLPGATSLTLVKPGMTGSDVGFYILHVTSSIVTGLTLESQPYMAVTDPCPPGPRSDGTVDLSFNPLIDIPTFVNAIELQSDGKIIASLSATTINSIPAQGIVRFNTNGSLDGVFTTADYYPGARQLIVQPDDKILAVESVPLSTTLRRLNGDGSLDGSFTGPSYDNSGFYQTNFGPIALQADGKVLYAVTNTFNFQDQLIRTNADGTIDGTFTAPTNLQATVIRQQANGMILVGSSLAPGIIRLDVTGIDVGFNYGGANGDVQDIAIQPDGKIVVVGTFTEFNGQPHYGIVRLHQDGSTDNTFNLIGLTDDLEQGYTPYKIIVQSDGKIVLAGFWITWNGSTRRNIVRLNTDGSVDCSFDPGVSANAIIDDMVRQTDNKLLIAGGFTTYDATTRNGLARINNAPPVASCLPVAERAALVALYTSTNGAGWTNNTNWLNADESTWFGVTISGCHVTHIELKQNNLVGTIPILLGSFPNLISIDLSLNHLSGTIPVELFNLSTLEHLELQSNQLTGTIPPQLGNATSLAFVKLSDNLFTGSIPVTIGNLTDLFLLDLSINQLTGPIPTTIGNLPDLYHLDLSINQLTGPIPSQIGTLTLMKFLYLYENQLTGPIPPELGNLTALEILDIFTNQLTGTLPIELALCTQLKHLEVANNLLVGTLPVALQSLTNLETFQINDNSFTGAVPVQYLAWTNIRELYLSNNQLDAFPTFPPALITNLAVENNKMEFGDLESSIGTTGYVYNPQANLPGGTLSVNAGNTLTIPFTTSGTANQYQWYKDAVLIPGATTATFSQPSVTGADAGDYVVEITSTIVTGLTLSSFPFVVTVTGAINIAPQPVDFTACESVTATFNTNATGTTNITYQWQFSPNGPPSFVDITNGANYSGATTNTLSVNTTASFGVGRYRCKVNGDLVSTVFTNDAGLFINPLPSAPIAGNGNNCGPGTVTLTATGGINGQYRWYTAITGGTAIVGEVNNTYITPIISSTTTYYITINNGACESAPRMAVIATIHTLPTAPGGTPNSRCGPGTVLLGATGGVNGQYRWYTGLTGGTAIAGEVNSNYTTPSLSVTTTYFVTIDNGTCESIPRTPVVATINTLAKPILVTSNCTTTSATLTGPAGFTGYAWSNGATTQQIIVTVAGSYTLIVTTASGCSSPPSDPVIISPTFCNLPPIITTTTINAVVDGIATLNLSGFLSDPDGNLDLTTLKIFKQPTSGAAASIGLAPNFVLTVDYTGTTFTGKDEITLEVCDLSGVCVRQIFLIEVDGDIIIYNGISPNGNGQNDKWVIEHIEALPDTKDNHISVYNRWGDEVFEINNYNNTSRVFTGHNKSGDELPVGTYFYKIEFASGRTTLTGFISLKR